MYLTYNEYITMGGTLDEATFNNFEFEAECFINWITFNRLRNEESYSEEVKRCVYDLISLISLKRNTLSGTSDAGANGSIAQMQNDGVSVTYNTMSAVELFDKVSVEARHIVVRYLNGVENSQGKLLTYRGLYADE